ncbi:MAG: lipoyl(octanoyl) transferase LipB [Planctomycetota bacterium]
MNDIHPRELGCVAYEDTLDAMRDLAIAVAAGRRRGEVWFLEHRPVYTAGRAATRDEALAIGAVPIERGGRITYHGPGQLVVYPIVRLPERDVGAWLRRLERYGSALCAAFGLEATPSPDGTGVFVDGRKIASIGVALRRWTNLHGIAVNVDLDLAPFFAIRPCGLAPEVMTDLTRAAGRPVAMHEVVEVARESLPVLLAPSADS